MCKAKGQLSHACNPSYLERITVPDQPGQKTFERLHLNRKKSGHGGKKHCLVYVPVIPAMAGSLKLENQGPGQLGQKQDPISKKIRAKTTEPVVPVIEHLPSKHKPRV
jgi:hypothetical protein